MEKEVIVWGRLAVVVVVVVVEFVLVEVVDRLGAPEEQEAMYPRIEK
jgi:hypothetical protein